MRYLRLYGSILAWAVVLLLALAGTVNAKTCLAPLPPFVPNDTQVALEYADIIRQDFEFYIRDIQDYFRCLDAERSRAFEEAREVSQAYGRFLQLDVQ